MPVSPVPARLILIAGLLASSAVLADAGLHERYVAAGQKMGEQMLTIVADCLPEVDTSGIDIAYTPRMSASAQCVVDTHLERFGREETVELIEQTEALAAREFSSMSELMELQADYPRLSTPAMIEINQACETIQASRDLPLTKLMEENMSELAACFSR